MCRRGNLTAHGALSLTSHMYGGQGAEHQRRLPSASLGEYAPLALTLATINIAARDTSTDSSIFSTQG